jgi:aryl-alcohol dehydrogenase-like predicted oxidoreductase
LICNFGNFVADKNIKETRDAFNAGMDGGLTFFDTAGVN